MATDQGNRAESSEVDSSSVEQEETLIEGWCSTCTCQNLYHIGDNEGICIECKCPELTVDDNSDLLDRLKGLIISEVEEGSIELVEEPEVAPDEKPKRREVFMGQASRGCKNCGDVKLYRDFNNSEDPKVLCNYCAWEKAGEEELIEIEEEIIENERAYEDALERNEMIIDFLRGLDE